MFILRLTVLLCLFAACSRALIVNENASDRVPAQSLEYRSCQPIQEQLIQVRAVNYETLEKNFKNVKDCLLYTSPSPRD